MGFCAVQAIYKNYNSYTIANNKISFLKLRVTMTDISV